MFEIPNKYALVVGAGEGRSELTAFDAALYDAGVGNYNLVKMSSIMPPGAKPSQLHDDLPPGSLLPVAYGAITSAVPGETISAAVAAGITGTTYGVIMEHKGRAPREVIEREVTAMVREALTRRGLPIQEIIVASAEHAVGTVGCAFAGIAIWR